MEMTGDLWALFAALVLASVQLTVSSVLTLAPAGRGLGGGAARHAARGDGTLAAASCGPIAICWRYFRNSPPRCFWCNAAHAAGSLSVTGAWMFVFGRIAYVPAYAFAPAGVRPFFWLVAQAGILRDPGRSVRLNSQGLAGRLVSPPLALFAAQGWARPGCATAWRESPGQSRGPRALPSLRSGIFLRDAGTDNRQGGRRHDGESNMFHRKAPFVSRAAGPCGFGPWDLSPSGFPQ